MESSGSKVRDRLPSVLKMDGNTSERDKHSSLSLSLPSVPSLTDLSSTYRRNSSSPRNAERTQKGQTNTTLTGPFKTEEFARRLRDYGPATMSPLHYTLYSPRPQSKSISRLAGQNPEYFGCDEAEETFSLQRAQTVTSALSCELDSEPSTSVCRVLDRERVKSRCGGLSPIYEESSSTL
mmetsp:Transcript_10644/g.28410  ORF Transcript_10644/g.28410 Transcript_10644/m.28410 type:complete len:180 (+) Transcript_10644:300-839(+)